MNQKLSDYFRRQVKYDSQEISGVLGLKNASDLLYDKTPKELGLIHPPFLPNLRFSRFAPTEELICWGSFGLDPDLFLVKNPTFYLHKTQLQDYCRESQQQMDMIYQPHDLTFENSPEYDTDWSDQIGQPLLDFLSNLTVDNLVSEVNEEMVIDLAGPETGNEVINDTFDDTVTYLD